MAIAELAVRRRLERDMRIRLRSSGPHWRRSGGGDDLGLIAARRFDTTTRRVAAGDAGIMSAPDYRLPNAAGAVAYCSRLLARADGW
jgi:hypothetical protein